MVRLNVWQLFQIAYPPRAVSVSSGSRPDYGLAFVHHRLMPCELLCTNAIGVTE